MENEFTARDFKLMKRDLDLNNKDVADIIGTSEANVKIQTNEKKPLGTWAKSMIYVWQHYKKARENELKKIIDDYFKEQKK
jgi:hypothetical protein